MKKDAMTFEPSAVRHGWVHEYWEQGWEGDFWRIFQDARFCDSRLAGWRPEGIARLADGQRLTILADDDAVLWTGRLLARKIGRCQRLPTQPWQPAWHPLDVSAETWAHWFSAHPPLRASLQE